MICYNCGKDVLVQKRPWRQDTCPNCNAYLHSCRNCRFHDENIRNQCREPMADWITDKELGNFCDYFEASLEVKKVSSGNRREDARKKLEELFKKQ